MPIQLLVRAASMIAVPGILVLNVCAAQAILYVRVGAAGTGDGSSWKDAYPDLQQALVTAQAEDQVWVAEGTYKPDLGTLDPHMRFELKSGVELFGGFAGVEESTTQRDIAAHATVLSGDLLGNDGPQFANYSDNSYMIVHAEAPAAGTRLDGLSIVGANGTDISVANQGGGLYVHNGVIAVARCTFSANDQYIGSGAVRAENAVVTMCDCLVLNNRSHQGPGGVNMTLGSAATITRCRFLSNVGPLTGGALGSAQGATVTVNDCIFTGNTTANYGGAVVVWDASADFTNCTMTGNTAGSGGAAMSLLGNCNVHVRNCILWGNNALQSPPLEKEISPDGVLTVDFSTLTPPIAQFGGTSNLESDPLFVDADGVDGIIGTIDDDCRLQPSSPCIDSGSNALVPADALDADCDGDVSEPTPLDLVLVNRFEDDPDKSDLPGQLAPVVDRGAYEFSRWTNIAHGLGDEKSPCLVGSGSWKPGLPLGITITGGKRNAFGVLFVGASEIDAPFKGGVMVPYPQFLNGITTDPNGQLSLQGVLPANAPAGFETFLQAWLVDASGPKGLAATNAVMGTSP